MALPGPSAPPHEYENEDPDAVILDPSEAAEEINVQADDDEVMNSDSDGEDDTGDIEVEVHNDSSVYFDAHNDSIFSIAQHPIYPGRIIVTGGGDDKAQIWEVPGEEESGGVKPQQARLLKTLDGHTDSVAAVGFSKKDGRYVVTAGLDGRLRSWRQKPRRAGVAPGTPPGVGDWEFASEVQEVEEINWLEFHPTKSIFAIGASDGSVWIYDLDTLKGELQILHALYNHTSSCTAGTWTPDGSLLCTVSDDGSFNVHDHVTGRALVALTAEDSRFAIDGGLFSVAVNWDSTIAVVGGATGACKVIGLPRAHNTTSASSGRQARGGRAVPGGDGGVLQAGQIIATLQAHTQSVESLSFSRPVPLLASSSVDGTIVLYDTSRGFAVRRTIPAAHPNTRDGSGTGEDGENTVVKIEFVNSTYPPTGVLLTSCGVDGTVKRWDGRSGQEVGCWKGHSDGVLGFVQTDKRIVSAGDDHIALVFDLQQSAVSHVHAVPGAAVAAALGPTPPNPNPNPNPVR
ncbi:60S ribosome biogenesis protein Sqt1 [Peziza echinospora]|nr:60S ribosome biogenesis protein Sqt1 [Peziza echinospora]